MTKKKAMSKTLSKKTSVRHAAMWQIPVVDIGASAGGLDAYKRFFSGMPTDSGEAFVLIPHLDPTHKSPMVELMAEQTTINQKDE